MSCRIFSLLFVFASFQRQSKGQELNPAQLPTSAAASIPHSLAVAEFTPPAPPVVKTIPVMRVDAALTVPTKSSRTLTLIRGAASTLPDIPPPPIELVRGPRVLTPEDIARNLYRRRHNFQFGATVYDQRVSQVHWTHPDTGESYEALCGFDIGLLAGIGSFVSNEESYKFMLNSHNIDTTAIRRVFRQYAARIPDVPADSITILKGNPNDQVGTSPITLIKELITNERNRLINYHAARLRHHKATAAWEKAHPVPPRDETFWFKPHRGSRYLATPKPEAAIK